MTNSRRWIGAAACLSSLFAACASDSATIVESPMGSGDGDSLGAQPSLETSAVMVAVNVRAANEDSILYVGAYPTLPEGDLTTERMMEVGNDARATAYGGYVYVWEGVSGKYTRYSVDDSLRLRAGPAVSFASLGATGPSVTSFVSPTQAYTLTTGNQQIVAWNPTTMELVGSVSTDAFIDPDYPRVEYGEPVVFGQYVAWPILWSDYDNFRFKPEVGVALARVNSLEPALVVRDARCGAGWSLHTGTTGDLFATGNGYFGFAHFFGAQAASYPADCVLRMPAGTTSFDPDYRVNLNELADTPAVYHTWHVSEHTLLAAVWDEADDPLQLASSDDYWNAPLLRKLVHLDTGESSVVQGMPKSAVWSTLDYRLDGVLYVPESVGTLDEDGTPGPVRTTLYAVTNVGAVRAFSTRGDIWAIGRIR